MPSPTIPLPSSLFHELQDYVARENAGVGTTVEVRLGDRVASLQFSHVDPVDGTLVAEHLDTGRLAHFTPTDVVSVHTPCPSCGEDFLADVSDEDCDARWTGGHRLPVCTGCGDEVPSASDGWRHQRCHLIP